MHELRDATTWITLGEAPLDAARAAEFVGTPEAGAVNLFVGTTRQWTDGHETTHLAYEAYAPLALTEMRRLAEEVCRRHGALRVAIHHRLGTVDVGEASVVIAVSSAHRAASFDACRWLIDELKVQVPIWKREHFRSGVTEWVEGDRPPALPED